MFSICVAFMAIVVTNVVLCQAMNDDAGFKDRCKKNGVDGKCLSFCSYSKTATDVLDSVYDGDSCFLSHADKILQAAAAGADNTQCCQEESIGDVCYKFCNPKIGSTRKDLSYREHIQCAAEYETIRDFHRLGTGLSEDSDEQTSYPTLFCDIESAECAEAQCPTNDETKEYCLRTINETRPCENMFQDCINVTEPWVKYCPVDAVGWCAAMANNPKDMWYAVDIRNNATCQERTAISPVSFKGKALRMFDYIVVDAEEDAKVRFDCPKNSPFYESKIENTFTHGAICRDKMEVKFWYANVTGLAAWAIRAHKNEMLIGEFKYIAISLGGHLLLESGNKSLSCRFTGDPEGSLLVPGFSIIMWWTRNDTLDVYDSSTTTYARLHGINESDEYQCHANVSFKSCTPYFTTFRMVHSEIFKLAPVTAGIGRQYILHDVLVLCSFVLLASVGHFRENT